MRYNNAIESDAFPVTRLARNSRYAAHGGHSARSYKAPMIRRLLMLAAAAMLGGGAGSAAAAEQIVAGDEAPRLARVVSDLWREGRVGSERVPAGLRQADAMVYLAARDDGRRIGQVWRFEGSTLDRLKDAVKDLKTTVDARQNSAEPETLELVLAHDARPLTVGAFSNIHRGVRGLMVRYGGQVELYSPTYALTTNRDGRALSSFFRKTHGIGEKAMAREARFAVFDGGQWLIRLASGPDGDASATRMTRGNRLVPLSDVTHENTQRLATLAAGWMSRNLHDDGRMTYKYWPSPRKESDANNMIRQWMATLALIRSARHNGDDALMQRAAENIDYNLAHFYREEDGLGLIEWSGKIKLGAVALAALALFEHPDTERWQAQHRALARTVETMHEPSGAFQTFYEPAARTDGQNFYPGEALLYWATRYERSRDDDLLARIMRSFRYYRAWHLDPDNRNPAFIPWHTQALYKVWRITGDDALRDFIYRMNDWLIDQMQQTADEAPYPDVAGRFYKAGGEYGPPHASSTGVYLEGLADAYALARAEGDKTRSDRYRTAIRRGLRNVMQLQFADDIDMFYVPDSLRNRVRGGIRETVYNNEIRCDNVQHNLMAAYRILDVFEPEDYRPEDNRPVNSP